MENDRLITREQADQIIQEHWDKPMQPVVICYKGWYDIRGMTAEEIKDFILKLIKN